MKHILWDFDGTLFDTYPAIIQAFLAVLQEYELEYAPPDIERLVKIDTGYCAEYIEKHHQIDKQTFLNRVRSVYNAQQQEQHPFNGAREICEQVCHVGYNFLVTHRDANSTMRMLEQFQFTPYFARIITRDDRYLPKPNGESFAALITGHDVEPAETLGLGDRELDVGAANAVHIHSCYFHPGGEICDLADRNIATLYELSPLIG